MRHDWSFVGAVQSEQVGSGDPEANRCCSPVLIAVCRECGTTYAETVAVGREGQVPITGDCARRPEDKKAEQVERDRDARPPTSDY
jgi:hypothetical protein